LTLKIMEGREVEEIITLEMTGRHTRIKHYVFGSGGRERVIKQTYENII
jgi:hypothetical protein